MNVQGISIGELDPRIYQASTEGCEKTCLRRIEAESTGVFAVVSENPLQNPPPYEKLVGDLNGAYSRRINIQHRLVYEVVTEEKIVKVLCLWTHYE